MPGPLVATKLFVPKPPRGVVERPRLIERLQAGVERRLTLVSAPAGFGKSTLLAEWLDVARPAKGASAWLAIDSGDNDPRTFWSYVVAAMQSVVPGLGDAIAAELQSGQPPTGAMLAGLVNELATLPRPLHLVLDDYHLVENGDIHANLAALLDRLPPHVHLAIGTRIDPPLPLARLRARGDLVELRAADLRFTGDEVGAYLNEAMQLGLSPADTAALGERTEGWIAALQLAALSMRGRADAAAFVTGFAGNDRYVFDYLVEEVLQRQPEDVRRFLLDTSFLDRLSGPLCDAVIGAGSGQAMLDRLDRANLFLMPLDDRREWYRYHHLFADVLLSHLRAEGDDRVALLHARASDWFARNREPREAIRHALAAKDFERAAPLIEFAIPETARTRGEALIRAWCRALPDALVRSRPVLGIGFVGALVSNGEFDGIEDRLAEVERGLAALTEPSAGAAALVADQSQLPGLPSALELYRTAMAQMRGDLPGVIRHAQRVIDLAPPGDHFSVASGSSFLGIAQWSEGNLDAARRAWTTGRDGLRRAGRLADTLGASIALADIGLAQGRLRDAMAIYQQALEVSASHGLPVLKGTADMHAGLAACHIERNDLDAARRHLAVSDEVGEQAGLPQHPSRWRIAMARLRLAEGNRDAAIAFLDEAERLYVSDFFPNVRPIAAIRARVWIADGRLDEASRWQREAGLADDGALTYLREYEYITLARLELAREAAGAAALPLLGRLLDDATGGGRTGSVIEISLLQALALRHSDADTALATLERALGLAEPEGYVRIFVEGGEPMAALLKSALKRGVAPAHVRRLLAALGPAETTAQLHPDLIEPLSDRELDVLRLLRSELGGPEIARELMVSLNTLRTHTRNIYEKLGVSSRRSAVNRAEALNLFRKG